MKKEIEESFFTKKNKGQVTIFVIIAIVIVAGILIYFFVGKPFQKSIPKEMRSVYDAYLSCIEERAKQGISLMGEQGGYIEVPEFIPGSQYMPFSSQLDFLGQPIPYWLYISGNNLLKEQVPSKTQMEEQLAKYIGERLNYCDFSDFNQQGYDVFVDKGNVKVKINELDVEVKFDNDFVISFSGDSVLINNHELSVKSRIGRFYKLATKLYDFEKKNSFLEEYALDVLRLYAPVDGVELTCSPKVFVDENIKNELNRALEANIGALKVKGNYYELKNKEEEYFVIDFGENINENANFIYSSKWPSRFEIYGDRVARPVGIQQGMGILGFCYVPYHLIYDLNFPVLIQFYEPNTGEIFQFPIAVIIDKNQPRQGISSKAVGGIEPELCQYKNKDVSVYTYDSSMAPVKSRIKFKCLNQECYIGETEISGDNAVLNAKFPQCVNGFIIADSEGFATSKYQISTNEEKSADIILDKIYNISIDVIANGNPVDYALVSFNSDKYSTSVLYPDYSSVKLIEGEYNVSVYVYRNSTLKLPAISDKKCINVPKSGIGALFGAEEEKCFDITIPEQEIDFSVIGGGKTADYFIESLLQESQKINVNVPVFDTPKNLQELQDNYNKVEESIIDLEFK